jgi:uridine kinase
MKILLMDDPKIIVVVGLFASGKSTLVAELAEKNKKYTVYHTDDFIDMQQDAIVHKIKFDEADYIIVEGASAYNLLVKELILPDLVINCFCSDGARQDRYMKPERWNGGRYKGAKAGLKDYKAFDNIYRNQWERYKKMHKRKRVRIIEYCTEPIV